MDPKSASLWPPNTKRKARALFDYTKCSRGQKRLGKCLARERRQPFDLVLRAHSKSTDAHFHVPINSEHCSCKNAGLDSTYNARDAVAQPRGVHCQWHRRSFAGVAGAASSGVVDAGPPAVAVHTQRARRFFFRSTVRRRSRHPLRASLSRFCGRRIGNGDREL